MPEEFAYTLLPSDNSWLIFSGYFAWMTETGQPPSASFAPASCDGSSGWWYTSASPSSAIRKTSGQVPSHKPHDIQPPLSISTCISSTPFRNKYALIYAKYHILSKVLSKTPCTYHRRLLKYKCICILRITFLSPSFKEY